MNTTEATYAPHRHASCIQVQALLFENRITGFYCFVAAS